MKTPKILRTLIMGGVAVVGMSFLAQPAEARKPSVGLGVGAGVAIPTGDVKFKLSEAWGFYTDIPLLSSFHITPSTLVYRLRAKEGDGSGDSYATDVSVNFKFMVPLNKLSLFAGVTAGVTQTNEIKPHVGALVGGSMNLVSNLDVFVNVSYRYLIQEAEVHDYQIFAGPLFRFNY